MHLVKVLPIELSVSLAGFAHPAAWVCYKTRAGRLEEVDRLVAQYTDVTARVIAEMLSCQTPISFVIKPELNSCRHHVGDLGRGSCRRISDSAVSELCY